jgi:phosphoribosyl-AMP cyclohydrolase
LIWRKGALSPKVRALRDILLDCADAKAAPERRKKIA